MSIVLVLGSRGTTVSELRIRLAGFGGLLPGDVFDDAVSASVKLFETTYMHRQPTGVVDAEFATAFDEFSNKYMIDFKQLACDCGKCKGFGAGRGLGQYTNTQKLELYHKYEYPGMHRSLLWAVKAVQFFCEIDTPTSVRYRGISCGYRCQDNNIIHKRTSTNHMGKAVDLVFENFVNGKWSRDTAKDYAGVSKAANTVRTVLGKRMNAQLNWGSRNRFSMEPGTGTVSAPTWVHVDVREWDKVYLEDEYFAKDAKALNGESLTAMLKA